MPSITFSKRWAPLTTGALLWAWPSSQTQPAKNATNAMVTRARMKSSFAPSLRAAAEPLEEHDVRVTLADGGKNEPPVRRPRHPPRHERRAIAEVGDLPPLAARRRERPDVGRGAVGERLRHPFA